MYSARHTMTTDYLIDQVQVVPTVVPTDEQLSVSVPVLPAEEMLAAIRADALTETAQYLIETVVPFGGE